MRRVVIQSIAKFYRPEAFEVLAAVVENETNPLIVTEALKGLGKFPNEEVSPILTQALARKSYQHAIAVAVIGALRAQGDPGRIDLLRNHLEDHASEFRTRDFGRALDTLAFLGRNESPEQKKILREELAGHLIDPRRSLRPVVIGALATLEDPVAIPILQGIVSAGDEDSADYQAAVKAIENLNGEKKQATEVRDLRKEVLELQRGFADLKKKLESVEKKAAPEK